MFKIYRTHSNLHNLSIIDMDEIAEYTTNETTNYLLAVGLHEDDITETELRNLRVHYLYKAIQQAYNETKDPKNTIFYINPVSKWSEFIALNLIHVTQFLPVLYYLAAYHISFIDSAHGESFTLEKEITEYRYSFPFEKYTEKMRKQFLKKYKIN
jgi:hypothetical protein